MIHVNTKTLNAAVAKFKALFTAHPELIESGQFYVRDRLQKDLISQALYVLEQTPRLQTLNILGSTALVDAKAQLKVKLDRAVVQIKLDEVMRWIDANSVNGDLDPLKAYFSPPPPTKADQEDVRRRFTQAWSSSAIGTSASWAPYNWPELPTLQRALAARAFENTKCFDVAKSMAQRIVQARKVSRLPMNARISAGVIAGARVKRLSQLDKRDVAQELIEYTQPKSLDAGIQIIKRAVDAGGVVQCGALSGAQHENSAFPSPEHYVLVFARDTIEGIDVFLFWDPDVVVSDLSREDPDIRWGAGFGCLYYADGRLSTAVDKTDLLNIVLRKETEEPVVARDVKPAVVVHFGDHLATRFRHCYQIYSVQTWPA